MPSLVNDEERVKEKEKIRPFISTRRLTLLAMLLCCAVVIGFIERSIPLEFAIPGVRLGLANVIVLFALYKMKPGQVFALVILKCILTSVFVGSFTALAYSLGGSLLSFGSMALLLKINREFFSPVGLSVIGAICHNTGQILVAAFILGSFLVTAYMPALLISGLITGALVGIIVKILVGNVALSKLFDEK